MFMQVNSKCAHRFRPPLFDPQRGGVAPWGRALLTPAKMKDCRWLKPVLVAQIEFVEWTGDNHLRHTKFIALRDDKAPDQVRRE
jgi:ATP-dependent DNA ligase